MLDYLKNCWDGFWQWSSNKAVEATSSFFGNGIATLGITIEGIAAVVIILGILLFICRNTKVFRYGCLGYLSGLLLELIGSAMMK